MKQFNLYKGGITNKYPSGVTTLEEVIGWIRSDRYAETVATVRAQENKKAADFHKKGLDYVTFSGIFAPYRLAANLQEHSGMIVLDFDNVANVEQFAMQLETNPFAAAVFASPGGNGIKVVVKVALAERKHEVMYADLAYYFNTAFKLEDGEKLDPSGSDPSRACFLSHDPMAYYNPDAVLYTFRGAKPEKKAAAAPVQNGDISTTEQHIAAVVDRIEASQMDICGEYSNEWLLIAFSFATLGESGRQYFHRVSRLNAKYEEKDADEKFDNALKTTRFTTPAKFFSICKDYGIDVSKPKIEPAATKKTTTKKAASPAVSTPKKEDKKKYKVDGEESEFHPTVWYRDNGISIKVGKYWDRVADNFQLYISYKTMNEQEEYTWVIKIVIDGDREEYMEVLHDDLMSAKKLKTMLATKSLGFKIKDSHLDELLSYLFHHTDFATAMKISRYGYHVPSRVFFFSNVALNIDNGNVMQPDEFGIVRTDKHVLSIPQQKKSKQNRFHLTDTQVTFQEFFQTYSTAHLFENAFLPTCFYIFSLFRDLAITHKNFSPILFLKGGAGTGKSSMVRVFTAAFGKAQEGVNLKNKNSDSALVKIMSQTSNCIVWFDEFHNELQGQEGILQSAYDNDGYHKSSDNKSIETDNVELHSALALTSNYLPENPIFFSRCLFVPIVSSQKTDVQRKAFYKLEDWRNEGLGCLTVQLLPLRKILEANENYKVGYDLLYNELKKRFTTENVPERLFANMAQVMAAPYVLNKLGHINMVLELEQPTGDEITDAFVEMGARFIHQQFRIFSDSSALKSFFDIVQMMFDQNQIQEGVHFSFAGPMLRLNFSKLYTLFSLNYRRTFYSNPPDRDTIQTELATLAGYDDWNSFKKFIRFQDESNTANGATTRPQYGACELEYSILTEKFHLELVRDTPARNTYSD